MSAFFFFFLAQLPHADPDTLGEGLGTIPSARFPLTPGVLAAPSWRGFPGCGHK